MKLAKAYMSGKVRRWHTHANLHQNVADHAWGVAFIIIKLHPSPSMALIKEALFHDSGEIFTGDVPTPCKKNFPAFRVLLEEIEADFRKHSGLPLNDLTQEEQDWLDFADSFEAVLFIHNASGLTKQDADWRFRLLGDKAKKKAKVIGLNYDRVYKKFTHGEFDGEV
jgi:5'-deoxynucleotidase